MKKFFNITLVIVLSFIITISLLNIRARALNLNSNYINAKKLNSGLVYEPTLILELEDVNELNDDANKYITSVILNVNSDMEVILESGKRDLTAFYDEYIKNKFIPILRINKDNCDAFIKYYKEIYTIYDLMIISDDLSLIGKIYEDSMMYILNSVYDIREKEIFSDKYQNYQYIADANRVGANILLANSQDENLSILAKYAASMTKVVWAKGNTKIDSVKTISSGCYGVVNNQTNNLVSAIDYFDKVGWQSSQFVAAHRGITKYCNENSLSSCLAAYSEGATHIEVDLQVLADNNIVLCHNSQTNFNSDKNGWYFVNLDLVNLRKAKLNDYNVNYGETYTTLEELVYAMLKTDVIMIIELKFDSSSTKAVDELKCIENFKRIMDSIPGSYGHFYAITFYAPLAEKMRVLMPEVPLGYIGGARSNKEIDLGLFAWSKGGGHKEMTDYANKIKFLRTYNIGLDENYTAKDKNSSEYLSNLTANFYLARGYFQNTWTYEDTSHFAMKSMVATTNKAEECAYFIKDIDDGKLELSLEELNSKKTTVKAYSYNGWALNKECEIIVVEQNDKNAKVLLYLQDDDCPYGLYSKLIDVIIK